MILKDLTCEACGQPLHADFSNNCECINKECLLKNKCFSIPYLEERVARKANNQPMLKERIAHGKVAEEYFGIGAACYPTAAENKYKECTMCNLPAEPNSIQCWQCNLNEPNQKTE